MEQLGEDRERPAQLLDLLLAAATDVRVGQHPAARCWSCPHLAYPTVTRPRKATVMAPAHIGYGSRVVYTAHPLGHSRPLSVDLGDGVQFRVGEP